MNTELHAQTETGVYASNSKGVMSLVHLYLEGDYGLEDVVDCFQLGNLVANEPDAPTALELTFKEVQKLKVLADANSFDYEDGFIAMCLDMHRFAISENQPQFCFLANF